MGCGSSLFAWVDKSDVKDTKWTSVDISALEAIFTRAFRDTIPVLLTDCAEALGMEHIMDLEIIQKVFALFSKHHYISMADFIRMLDMLLRPTVEEITALVLYLFSQETDGRLSPSEALQFTLQTTTLAQRCQWLNARRLHLRKSKQQGLTSSSSEDLVPIHYQATFSNIGLQTAEAAEQLQRYCVTAGVRSDIEGLGMDAEQLQQLFTRDQYSMAWITQLGIMIALSEAADASESDPSSLSIFAPFKRLVTNNNVFSMPLSSSKSNENDNDNDESPSKRRKQEHEEDEEIEEIDASDQIIERREQIEEEEEEEEEERPALPAKKKETRRTSPIEEADVFLPGEVSPSSHRQREPYSIVPG